MTEILNFLRGKKTYVVAVCGIIWGLATADYTVVLAALGLAGIRSGIAYEVAKIMQVLQPKPTVSDQPVVTPETQPVVAPEIGG